jgi:hypothetical protein
VGENKNNCIAKFMPDLTQKKAWIDHKKLNKNNKIK